jgi:putative copper export protein
VGTLAAVWPDTGLTRVQWVSLWAGLWCLAVLVAPFGWRKDARRLAVDGTWRLARGVALVLPAVAMVGLGVLVLVTVDDIAPISPWRAWQVVLTETPFGRASLVYTVLTLLTAAWLWTPHGVSRGSLLAALSLFSLGWGAHGAAESGPTAWLVNSVMGLHIVLAGVWLGALCLMVAGLVGTPYRQPRGSPHTGLSADPAFWFAWIQAFGKRGIWLVVLLAGTGAFMVWWRARGQPDWWHSEHATLLGAKLAGFGVMGLCALHNRASSTVSRLRWGVLTEATVALLVLWLAVALGAASPNAS